ncbi:MAG: 2-hydroxyglutaryl-CoA dehydratase [Eggerthellaceae bacterium]|nr:2-hydroxyglutaryl-CoA dehydratase [Eggerthellaceae bacterium]
MGFYLGIDVGSTASKCVIVDSEGDVVARGLYPTGAGTAGPRACIDEALAQVPELMTTDDVAMSCATGYGRHLETWADKQVSELSCHAKGAVCLFPGVRTVIDIGGQDAKVLSISKDGKLAEFVMNDKCAAGTGRFLDVMAGVFGCTVADLSNLDSESTEIAPISSTCTVFAESEVISKLAAGTPIPNIVAGVHESVVERTLGLAKRVGITPDVVMTGGVALNGALRERLEHRIGRPVNTCADAQYVGAYGAALFAREQKLQEAKMKDEVKSR